jgi:hypothetical protein
MLLNSHSHKTVEVGDAVRDRWPLVIKEQTGRVKYRQVKWSQLGHGENKQATIENRLIALS